MKKSSERIQKLLAHAGYGSRRQIEQWIDQGRITVDGQLATLGQRITPGQARILLDGRPVKLIVSPKRLPEVLLYHKPCGEICSHNDPQARTSVFAQLPPCSEGRWLSIGRLDYNTSGLLLFTNDGELAHRLMHPKQQIEREYAVRVLGKVDDSMLKRLVNGVELEDGPARFEHIVSSGGEGANHWFHLVVIAGRNRLVRRLWESQGIEVSRLMRVRYGPVILPRRLKQGGFILLSAPEVEQLINL